MDQDAGGQPGCGIAGTSTDPLRGIKACPFCGRAPTVRPRLYTSEIECMNPNCAVSPRVSARDIELALQGWNERHG